MKRFLFLIFALVGTLSAGYSQRVISGTITDAAGQALIGANVIAKEATAIGTITDVDGNFSLKVPAEVTALVISYAGYETQEVVLGASNSVNVSLSEGKLLDEVVVTALGISRSDKALGFQIDKVSSETIGRANAVNAIDALSGTVAGLQINSAAGTAGAATRMVIRGTTNLNGNNEALLVVDGIRISNAENHSERSLGGVAVSNRAVDLNPNDIESVSVLKGAAASALYGVDAANGVILITTKKGKKGQSATVEYGVTYGLDEVNRFHNLQNKFSQGAGGRYQAPAPGALRSWGAAIDTLRYDGATTNRFDKNGNIVGMSNPNAKTNVVPYDNLQNAFTTGITQSHNLSFLGGTDVLGFRIGAGYTDQSGVIPNNTFKRFNLSTGTNSSFYNDKLKISTFINYSNSKGSRIQQGSNTSGLLLGLLRTPITFDNTNGLSEPWNNVESYEFGDGTQRNYAAGAGFDNPYWVMNNSPFRDQTNRILGNINASYKFSNWVTLGTILGTDVYADNRFQGFERGSRTVTGGRVFEDNYNYSNLDAYLQLSGGDKISDKVSLNYLVGTNLFNEEQKQNFTQGDNLALLDYLHIANAAAVSTIVNTTKTKRVGFFGQLEAGYDSWLYLTLTGRQDYLSNLINPSKVFSAGDISVFYPSASLGIVLSDLVNVKFFDFVKLRASYAQVGGGAPAAYLTSTNFLAPTFNAGTVNDFNDGWTNGIGFPFLGVSGFKLDAVQGAFNLVPSLTKELEAGLDLRFWNNRVNLDIAGYDRKSDDQILVVPVASSSGFQRAVLNSGSLSTRGLDLDIGIDVIQTKSVNLNINGTFSTWKTYVESLAEGVQNQYLDGFTGSSVYNLAPETDADGNITKKYEYGQIWGGAWLRTNSVVDGNHVYDATKPYDPNGQLIIESNPTKAGFGYPIADPTNQVIGNPNPDFIAGIGADLTINKFQFNVLFDWRQGGDMWNGTKGALVNYGTHKITEERGSSIVFPGVGGTLTESGFVVSNQLNNVNATLSEAWYRGNGGGFGAVSEHFVEDASSFRIRNIGMSYDFGSLFNKGLKNLVFGVSANNILLWSPYDGIDPISSLVGSNSNGQGLDYFNNPATRSLIFKLNAKF